MTDIDTLTQRLHRPDLSCSGQFDPLRYYRIKVAQELIRDASGQQASSACDLRKRSEVLVNRALRKVVNISSTRRDEEQRSAPRNSRTGTGTGTGTGTEQTKMAGNFPGHFLFVQIFIVLNLADVPACR